MQCCELPPMALPSKQMLAKMGSSLLWAGVGSSLETLLLLEFHLTSEELSVEAVVLRRYHRATFHLLCSPLRESSHIPSLSLWSS